MKKEEFKAILKKLGWRYKTAAKRLGVSEASIKGWGAGYRQPPDHVSSQLRKFADALPCLLMDSPPKDRTTLLETKAQRLRLELRITELRIELEKLEQQLQNYDSDGIQNSSEEPRMEVRGGVGKVG